MSNQNQRPTYFSQIDVDPVNDHARCLPVDEHRRRIECDAAGRAQVPTVDADIRIAEGLEPSAFVDRGFLERELATIFTRSPRRLVKANR